MITTSRRRTRIVVCLAVLLLCGRRAAALNAALSLSQYSHTAWLIREGAFSGLVSSIAQTPDGYLWVGTQSGLLRFDGVRFVRWHPRGDERLPSEDISNLLVSRDGRLWIATFAGLVSLKDGHLVTYPELSGLSVTSLVEDAQSTVWAGTTTVPNARLCAIRRAVECVGQDGRFGIGIFSLFNDSGTLWAATAAGLWRWLPGEPRLYPTQTPNVSSVTRAAGGPLLVATSDGIRQVIGDALESYAVPGVDRRATAARLLADRDGAVWVGTRGGGVVHLHNERRDRFTRVDGLSGDHVVVLFEDREGNVWVATAEGLDRFRELSVTAPSQEDMPAGRADIVRPEGTGRHRLGRHGRRIDSIEGWTDDGVWHW